MHCFLAVRNSMCNNISFTGAMVCKFKQQMKIKRIEIGAYKGRHGKHLIENASLEYTNSDNVWHQLMIMPKMGEMQTYRADGPGWTAKKMRIKRSSPGHRNLGIGCWKVYGYRHY